MKTGKLDQCNERSDRTMSLENKDEKVYDNSNRIRPEELKVKYYNERIKMKKMKADKTRPVKIKIK